MSGITDYSIHEPSIRLIDGHATVAIVVRRLGRHRIRLRAPATTWPLCTLWPSTRIIAALGHGILGGGHCCQLPTHISCTATCTAGSGIVFLSCRTSSTSAAAWGPLAALCDG